MDVVYICIYIYIHYISIHIYPPNLGQTVSVYIVCLCPSFRICVFRNQEAFELAFQCAWDAFETSGVTPVRWKMRSQTRAKTLGSQFPWYSCYDPYACIDP